MSKSKLPPYGTTVDKFSVTNEIIICTGYDAWKRARSKTWIRNTPKLVLPFNDPPDAYKWPVKNRYVMIFSYGEPEPRNQLLKLSQCLLEAGTTGVLWVMSPMEKFA